MKKIYVVGDSISMHYGPHLERYLSGMMLYSRKEDDEKTLRALGIPADAIGGNSDKVLLFLRAKAASGTLDAGMVLLNCGLHDIRRKADTGKIEVPVERYRSNLSEIIALVREAKRELVWIRTTPCDENVHNTPNIAFHRFAADCNAYNAAADEIMLKAGVPVIDLHTFTCNLGDDLYCDHVHFKEHVREKQAAFIAGWLAGRL